VKISVTLPIRTVSEANSREHWRARHKRSKMQREAARLAMHNYSRNMYLLPKIPITLVRIGARKLDDDNLARSFKAIRDGIADAIGIDDGSEQYIWRYAQEKGKPKEYAVRVEIKA